MSEREYANVGEAHWNDQKNRGEISPVELRRSGTYNPIIVYISATLHLRHRGEFAEVEKMLW